MDLWVIMTGMGVGSLGGWFAVSLFVPRAGRELELAGAVGGAVLGALCGYLLIWLAKRGEAGAQRPVRVPRATRPQVVGSACAKCGERIMFIADAHVCPGCGRVLCVKCDPQLPCADCRAFGVE